MLFPLPSSAAAGSSGFRYEAVELKCLADARLWTHGGESPVRKRRPQHRAFSGHCNVYSKAQALADHPTAVHAPAPLLTLKAACLRIVEHYYIRAPASQKQTRVRMLKAHPSGTLFCCVGPRGPTMIRAGTFCAITISTSFSDASDTPCLSAGQRDRRTRDSGILKLKLRLDFFYSVISS